MRRSDKLQLCRTLLLTAVCAALAGCSTSREPRYFMLAPTGRPVLGERDLSRPTLTVNILPVRLPAYLDRPHIVTRPADMEIGISEFHRWGMPLAGGVTTLLADVVGRELTGVLIAISPGGMRDPGDDDVVHLKAEIIKLDGSLGGQVELDARWMIYVVEETQPVKRRAALYRQPVAGTGYDDYVRAIGLVLEQWGGDIAEDLRGRD